MRGTIAPSCLLPCATLQRFVAWKLLIMCTEYTSRIFNEAQKLPNKDDYCEFDYTLMAPTNIFELHAPLPPSAAHKLLVLCFSCNCKVP